MANWGQVLNLIPLVEGVNDNGFEVITEGEPRQVYANKLSVRSNEFHMAKQTGVELTHMFEVRSVDYDGEERLSFNAPDNKHDIYRTYDKGEFIELVCRKASDDHAT